MKRRKVDASLAPSTPSIDVRSAQQQLPHQCYRSNTNTSSARLYAQLQHPQQPHQLQHQHHQQQHQQLRVLLASGERHCLYREPESSSRSTVVPKSDESTVAATFPVGCLPDRPSSTNTAYNKHHCEPQSYLHHRQRQHLRVAQDQDAHLYHRQQILPQFPIPSVSSTATKSPNSSPNSISSLISPSNSLPTFSKSWSLPGLSTMLRITNHSGRQRSQSLSANWSLSVCSPILKQEENSSEATLRSTYTWAPEPTSTSFSRANSSHPKTSRYLREMDRREILARIEQGETQAELAKEFQVSRAAICNLNKHREDVLLRRSNNPHSRHPKKSLKSKISSSSLMIVKKKNQLSQPALNENTSNVGGMGNNIHEVKSRATAQLHTRLRNRNTSMSDYQRCSERLMRLVLEEGLALAPMKVVGVDGVGCVHPPCAISMENQEHTDCGCPLLDLFRAIEPDQPAARVRITEELDQRLCDNNDAMTKTQSTNQDVSFVGTHQLPAILKYHNVFVLDVSATSADAICAVVQKLKERGAVETMICIVVLFINSEIIASIHKKYPSVKFVAAQIGRSGKAIPFRYNQSTGCM